MDNSSNTNSSFQNNSSLTSKNKEWARLVVGSLMSPIILLGTIGNVLSLLVWIKVRRCRNSTACFLAALAVADLSALLTAGLNF